MQPEPLLDGRYRLAVVCPGGEDPHLNPLGQLALDPGQHLGHRVIDMLGTSIPVIFCQGAVQIDAYPAFPAGAPHA
jgi:hypothetical protein